METTKKIPMRGVLAGMIALGATVAGIAAEPARVQGQAPGPGSMVGEKDIKEDAARMALAPHTLMVETELLAALDQVRGLKAQVRTAESQPTPEFMEHYRVHRREIADSVKSVRTHEGELRERAARFPSVSRSEQYRALNPALNELERMNQQWDRQAGNRAYWHDTPKVITDLEQLEKRILTALEKARSLNTKLDVSEIG